MARGKTVRHPENREAILRLLRSGNTRRDAALFVGIGESTLHAWLRADQTLQREAEQAEAQARIHAVAVITDDARGRPAQFDEFGRQLRAEVRPNVSSAMWLLERRDPFNWGRRVTVDVAGLVRELAEKQGFDEAEVMAEIEVMLAEHGARMRGG